MFLEELKTRKEKNKTRDLSVHYDVITPLHLIRETDIN